ncbi:hypothetical protein MTP99_010287 [Tenebrio molitor]|jgi:hypothetical protein|nr:hypothetical protein MTP99_010287 [Tenebrio molitor]
MQVYVIKGTFNRHPTLALLAHRQARPSPLLLQSNSLESIVAGALPAPTNALEGRSLRHEQNKPTWMTPNSKQDN